MSGFQKSIPSPCRVLCAILIQPIPISSATPRLSVSHASRAARTSRAFFFVSDSLPDAWGNQLFDLWRQQNHLSGRLFSVGALSNDRIFGRIVDFRSDYVKPTDCSLSISTSTLFCLSVFLHLILLVVCLHSEVFALPSCERYISIELLI